MCFYSYLPYQCTNVVFALFYSLVLSKLKRLGYGAVRVLSAKSVILLIKLCLFVVFLHEKTPIPTQYGQINGSNFFN